MVDPRELNAAAHKLRPRLGHSASEHGTPDGTSEHQICDRYCFCAHMHEIMKYFLFTENQEQCLNV